MPTMKPKTLTAFLPATACTPEMREALVKLAEQRAMSLAEVQRAALTLFLRTNYTSCIPDAMPGIEGGDAA